MSGGGRRLELRVSAAPDPLRLRAVIASRIAGRPFPPGPEDEVGAAVARALREHAERPREVDRWR